MSPNDNIQNNDDDAAQPKPTSEKQIRANRENAKKSTGAKSEAGKAKSAQNATKHHIFVSKLEPVQDGSYAEDPEEFYERVEILIKSLGPRDAIEHEVAIRIVGTTVRLERLDRWSASAIESAAQMRDTDIALGARSEYRVQVLRHAAAKLVGHLKGEPASPDEFEGFAMLVRKHGPKPGVEIRDLWSDEREPSTPEEWRTAFVSLRKHFWKTDADAIAWGEALELSFSRRLEMVTGLESRIAANRILNGPLELDTVYETRLRNNLERYLKVFRELQERPGSGV